jgi:hypothetical protein
VQIKAGERAGSWSYGDMIGGDNSNSQFAVLALHEAERAGALIDPQTWRFAADYWKRIQEPNGSWGYQPGLPSTGSMTAAGIGAWVICSDRVAVPSARVENGAPQCCLPPTVDDVLERAISWMGRNFSVTRNPGQGGGGMWHLYYLYGLERVGRLTANRMIGDHDWYREAPRARQPAGPFQPPLVVARSRRGPAGHRQRLRGFLFRHGRRPILVAKLKHGPGEDWNHRTDMANITALAEEQWGLDLTWQIIDPHPSNVEDLLQAPVLFLTGSKRPELDGLDRKMRDYIDRGGFLFAEACCIDGSQFDAGLRQFLDRVFPEGEYKLRRIGPEHPLWRIDRLVRPESPYVGRLWTVEYGCRTCVVFSEVDLSCYWELSGQSRRENPGDSTAHRRRQRDRPQRVRLRHQPRAEGQRSVVHRDGRRQSRRTGRPRRDPHRQTHSWRRL